jgi:hypothetical protein
VAGKFAIKPLLFALSSDKEFQSMLEDTVLILAASTANVAILAVVFLLVATLYHRWYEIVCLLGQWGVIKRNGVHTRSVLLSYRSAASAGAIRPDELSSFKIVNRSVVQQVGNSNDVRKEHRFQFEHEKREAIVADQSGTENTFVNGDLHSAMTYVMSKRKSHKVVEENGNNDDSNHSREGSSEVLTRAYIDKANADAQSVLRAHTFKANTSTEVAVDVLESLRITKVEPSYKTWELLIATCVKQGDLPLATDFLMQMEKAGMKPPKKLLENVMVLYSEHKEKVKAARREKRQEEARQEARCAVEEEARRRAEEETRQAQLKAAQEEALRSAKETIAKREAALSGDSEVLEDKQPAVLQVSQNYHSQVSSIWNADAPVFVPGESWGSTEESQPWNDAWCTNWDEIQTWECAEETTHEATWFEAVPELHSSHWVPSHETKPWWDGHSRDTTWCKKGQRLEDLIGIAYPSIEIGAWQSLGTEALIVETKGTQASEKHESHAAEKCDMNGDAEAQEFPYTTIDGIPFREWLGEDADVNQVDSVIENAETNHDKLRKADECMRDAKSKRSIALVAPLPPRKTAPKSSDGSNKDDAKASSKGEPDAEMEPEACVKERWDDMGSGREQSWVPAPAHKGKGSASYRSIGKMTGKDNYPVSFTKGKDKGNTLEVDGGAKGLRSVNNGYGSNDKGSDNKGKMSSKDAAGKYSTDERAANIGKQVERADFGYHRAMRGQTGADDDARERKELAADPQSSPSAASTKSTRTSTPARGVESRSTTWVQKKVAVGRAEWVEKERNQENMPPSASSENCATKYKSGWKNQSARWQDAGWWPKYTKRAGQNAWNASHWNSD